MSQNPNGPNYNPYGQNPNPGNPNYPAAPGTAYGGSQPPSGSNPYAPYPPSNPPSGPNPNTPNSAYNSPYQPANPPSGPNLGEPNSSYGSYGNPYAPPPPVTESNPYDPYAQTAMSQQNISSPGYPAYNPPSMPGQMPGQPPYLPPQQPGPQKPRRTGAIIIVVIALVVIIGGAFGFVGYSNNQNTQHANGTATAIANNNVQATATGLANQNAAATAANTYPFSTKLVLNDPMTDNSKGANWDVDKANGCFFSGSAYHVTDDQQNTYNPCFATHVDYSNFTFQAEFVLNQGDGQADSGLIFRADKNSNKFYRFTVDDAGDCSLLVSVDTTGTNTRDLKDCSASQFNSGLGVTNTMSVVAKGEQLSFYINQQLITTVSDSTYSHGEIGFSVGNSDSKLTEAIFSNVKVWQL